MSAPAAATTAQLGWADHLFVSCCGYIAAAIFTEPERLQMHQAEAAFILPKVNEGHPQVAKLAAAFRQMHGAPPRSMAWHAARIFLARAYSDFLEMRIGQAQTALGRFPS